MTPAGQQQNSLFVVRCGAVFLGTSPSKRAGCIERARQFPTFAEADAAAKDLRRRCTNFVLPWTVVELGEGEVQSA